MSNGPLCHQDLKGLRAHVEGSRHVRKAYDYKREVMGIVKQVSVYNCRILFFDNRSQPQNAPKEKTIKKPVPSKDVGQSLEEKLRECGQPAPGLEYIREYRNPKDLFAHPMYTCSLEGCKSSWGTSDDMFHHVIKNKHQKNFFKKMYPEDHRVAQLSKDQVLAEVGAYSSLCLSFNKEQHGTAFTILVMF